MNKKQEKKFKKISKAIDKLCKAMYGKEYKSIGTLLVNSVPNYTHSIDKGMVKLSTDVSINFTVVKIKDK